VTLVIPLAFLAALSAAVHWALPWLTLLLPLAVAGAAAALTRRPAHAVIAVAFLAAAVGILRPAVGSGAQSQLSRLVAEREVIALRGEVVDEPSPRDRAQFVRLRVSAVRFAEGEWRVADGTAHLTTRLVPALHHGDFVEARGRLQSTDAGASPGYAAYLRRQGIDAVAAFPFIEQRGERISSRSTLSDRAYDLLVQFRTASVAALERLLPEPHASLAQGILLGRRATVPAGLTENLRVSGLSHIAAVSGFNVSIVVGLVAATVGLSATRRGWRRILGVVLASAALWLFVVLVGFSGSVLRAAAMAQLALAGIVFGRRGSAGGMLLWGSALLAAWSPSIVTDVGWQLSFLGTAGLAWLSGPLERRLIWLPGILRSGLAATLAAQFFVFPVLISTFGTFSLVAPLANVLALPLVPWIMAAAFLAAVFGLVAAPAAPLFAALAWLPLSWLLWVVDWTASLPWAAVGLPPLGTAGVVIYLMLLATLCAREEVRAHAVSPDEEREAAAANAAPAGPVPAGVPFASPAPLRHRLLTTIAVAVAALLIVGAAMAQPGGAIPDAGGALLVELPVLEDGTLLYAQAPNGTRVLVDGGPTAGGAVALLGRYLRPWDRTVDAIILTDPRESHLLGAARILERYRVGVLLDAVQEYSSSTYRHTREIARRSNVRHLRLARDSPFSVGERTGALTLTPLPTIPRPDGGTFPLPLQLHWGAFTALLPGDATPAQLRTLLAGEHDLRSTLVVLPERLLRYPETARLLAAADPELIITQGNLSDAPSPADTDLPTAWRRTTADGPARLRIYPDGTYLLGP